MTTQVREAQECTPGVPFPHVTGGNNRFFTQETQLHHEISQEEVKTEAE